jgi:hypothetical protein
MHLYEVRSHLGPMIETVQLAFSSGLNRYAIDGHCSSEDATASEDTRRFRSASLIAHLPHSTERENL